MLLKLQSRYFNVYREEVHVHVHIGTNRVSEHGHCQEEMSGGEWRRVEESGGEWRRVEERRVEERSDRNGARRENESRKKKEDPGQKVFTFIREKHSWRLLLRYSILIIFIIFILFLFFVL